MNTAERILYLLKTRGPQTAQTLAGELELTSMATRRHLEGWQEKGLLSYEDRSEGVGRPARYWLLTEAGHARFPDRHGELTVALIQQIRQLFGETGLAQLITAREQEAERLYTSQLDGQSTMRQRAEALTSLRNGEGYMAQLHEQDDGSLLLVENHCPICAAARSCEGFCRSELAIFQRCLGDGCTVERTDHLLAGARRCAYRIVPVQA
ncbi:helix-turn-helix transcriptional regulator [Chitinimonas sp.]|uniref:helix-turn-helix transcriptional regulator n=1 Tax=Chitinimonas sp. TaxID=1934313 RepID=UPI0035B4ED54